LKVWWAKSLAASGHREAAVRVLSTVLEDKPGFLEARYNKAAYLSRMGKVDEAAPVLRRALDEGAATVYDVLEDPDFVDWLDDPAFSFLPRTSIEVQVEGPKGAVFLGGEFGLTYQVLGAGVDSLNVVFQHASGPVELISVDEDRLRTTGPTVVDLSFRYRVIASGTANFGPATISSKGRSGVVESHKIIALGPPKQTKDRSDLKTTEMRSPKEILGRHKIPEVWQDKGRTFVSARPSDKVVYDGAMTGWPIQYVYKQSGQPHWVVHSFPSDRVSQQIEVLRHGESLLKHSPE